ncbi:MAG: hypothetical protein AMJ56_15985 [Anaerolineae bacterium SG8_19]|jgi:hypothetical protein|nr:MAG: hypothetical protein AMJ56_15985 [Anaerolineae bacterium SG8_19]HCB50355.1 DUF4281 domain-containing protein [Chloroflexota bacterium]
METFFRFINIYPIPLWLAMMFAPKHRFTERAARSSSLFGIAALNYLMALLLGFRSGVSEDQGLPDFTSLDGISTSLGTREGALGAWSHMLALDLFTGAWIYRQCRRLNAPAWIRIPALFFTLMTGPLGLFLFLFWRLIGAGEGEAFPTDIK